jgi:hypothetical protein
MWWIIPWTTLWVVQELTQVKTHGICTGLNTMVSCALLACCYMFCHDMRCHQGWEHDMPWHGKAHGKHDIHDKYNKHCIWQVWQACDTWPAWHTWLTLPSFRTLQNLSIRKVMASLIAKYFIFYIHIYISLSHSLCSLCNALYVTHCKTPHSLLISPALTHAAPQNAQPVPSPDSCGKVHLRRWRPFASAPTELEQTKPTKRSEIHGPPFWSNGWHMVILSWNMLKSWNHQFQHQ